MTYSFHFFYRWFFHLFNVIFFFFHSLYIAAILVNWFIFVSLEFFIIGKKSPRIYKIIMINEVIIIAFTVLIFIRNYFSLSRGNNSTKLHGLWLISSWYLSILSQASVTPPEEPGKANIYFPLANTAQARDCIAEVPTVL